VTHIGDLRVVAVIRKGNDDEVRLGFLDPAHETELNQLQSFQRAPQAAAQARSRPKMGHCASID
jgi:hypothetical protein